MGASQYIMSFTKLEWIHTHLGLSIAKKKQSHLASICIFDPEHDISHRLLAIHSEDYLGVRDL